MMKELEEKMGLDFKIEILFYLSNGAPNMMDKINGFVKFICEEVQYPTVQFHFILYQEELYA